jgi:hypothetical protein
MKNVATLFLVGIVFAFHILSAAQPVEAAVGGYWTYATQYVANTWYPYSDGSDGRLQVAVPDKYVKFCIINGLCNVSYPAGRAYSINFNDQTFDVSNLGVGEVGPWNEDDNWWDPASNWWRNRRMFLDVTQGNPEAYVAVCCGYNGGRDQFGRIITTRPWGPGVDVSTVAAGWIGWESLENKWIYVYSFNWDY